MEASRRVLAKHQLATLQEEAARAGNNAAPARPCNEVRLRITAVSPANSIVSLQGRDGAGKDWLIMLSDEFFSRLPCVGDMVGIVPPWTLLRVPPEDSKVILGITHFSFLGNEEVLPVFTVELGFQWIGYLISLKLPYKIIYIIANLDI
jgi:hypothetical protein